MSNSWNNFLRIPMLVLALTGIVHVALAQVLMPANNAAGVCQDAQFKLTFNTAPVLQNAGKVCLYKSDGTLVQTIDLSQMPSGIPTSATWPWTEKLNGNVIRVIRVAIDGNCAVISFPLGSMAYSTGYYVTVDKNVFSNAWALGFSGIAAKQWNVVTRSKPVVDLSYTVAADGSGDFATLQGALDFIPSGNTSKARIFIKNGTYVGLAFSSGRSNITVEGESATGVILKAFNNNVLNASTHYRSVVNMSGNDLNFISLTIINTTPNGGQQAEALKLSGSRTVVVRCRFFSYQDTVLLEGKVYVKDCLIEGDVDFVWGVGTVFFQSCEIRATDNGGYNAMARNDNTKHGYAFADCRLSRTSVATATQYLGRDANTSYPYAELVYLNCSMDRHIAAVGWQIRNEMDAALIVFAEYKSVDMSGNLINTSSRHAKSRQLTAAQNTQYRDLNWFFNGWLPVVPAINPRLPETAVYALSDASATSDWATAANWSTASVPTALDTAVIRTGEVKLAQDFGGTVKVETNGIFRLMNYYAVPKILMQGGTLKVNTSMAGFGLNSAVTVASPSNILAGANVLSVFNLDGSISGKSNLTKTGGGAVKLTAAAPNFVGNWIVSEGTLSVNSATGLGTCGATVKPAATLSIESVAGTYSLSVETGGLLVLNKNLTVQAAVLGSVNLPAGNYRAADYPAIISGTGTLIVSGTLLAQTNTDADVTFKASTGSSYSWIKDAAAISTGATYTATDDGSYWVVATNSAGCKITSAPVAVSLVKTVAQSITLKEGWNLISINVRPADSTIATLFNGLDVLEIKDMKTYWRKDQPTFLNLLQTITPGEGYLVKMNAAGEFNLRGFPDLRGFKNLGGLAPGWSLIGCPYQTAEPIAGLLGSNFLMIKNFDGIWMLNGTANSIENLEPGKGYFVK